MGKRPFIVIIVFCLFWLAGCKQAAPESLPTLTAVPPQPTATATTPPTALPSPTMGVETAVVLPTDGPQPTQTTVKPTPLPTRPTMLPTVAFQANVDYKLIPSSTEALLNVVRRVSEFEDMHIEEHGGRSPYLEVNDFVMTDMDTIHPNSIPNAADLLEDKSLTSYYFAWWGPSSIHFRILEEGILQYLNQEKTEFASGETIERNGFSLTPYAFDSDDGLLWILQVDSFTFGTRIFLLLEQNEFGQYELIPSPLPTFTGRSYSDGWIEDVILDKDFTGDGKPEVVLVSYTVWSGTSERIFSLFVWNGNELVELEYISVPYFIDSNFEQTPQGVNEIHFTTQYNGRFDCNWSATDIYRWPNGIAQHILPEHGSPDTVACSLPKAIVPFGEWNSEKDDQYPLLEQIVNRLHTSQEKSIDFLVYAQSQLAMAYLEQGLYEKARQTIDQIYEMSSESEYAQVLQENDKTESVTDLCRELIKNAEKVVETEFGAYLTEAEYLRGRGMGGEPYKSAICDLKFIGLNHVKNAILPVDTIPEELLANLNLHYAFAQSANLDDDPELEWVGILEPEAPWLVIFDAENNQWVPHFLDDIYSAPVLDLKIEQKIFTDIVDSSLLTLISTASSYSDSLNYEVLLIDKIEQEYSIVASKHPYDEEPILQDLDRDYFDLDRTENILPKWKDLEGFLEEPEYISTYIETLMDSVITQSDPAIPTKITDLLTYLPTDDPEAQPYREHLTYLLGYHYELSDDEDQAVATYLDLIQQAPSSPWSWLAWARLEPAEE